MNKGRASKEVVVWRLTCRLTPTPQIVHKHLSKRFLNNIKPAGTSLGSGDWEITSFTGL